MKKIICFLILVFTILSATAQDKEVNFTCYMVATGNYNKVTDEIYFDSEEKTEFNVRLYKGSFRLANKAGSIYILKREKREKEILSDRTAMIWYAVDEEGKNCTVQIIKFKDSGSVQLQCFYSDVIIFFHLSPPL